MAEYCISKNEITRRERAYITLSLSLLISIIIFSTVFHFPIPLSGYYLLALMLFLIGIFSFIFFHSLLKTKIILSDNTFQRKNDKTVEEYAFSNIHRLEIKRTTSNTIREIHVSFSEGKSVFISALERFDQFEKELKIKLGKNVAVNEIREPLNYDHKLFYLILGLLLGFISVLAIKSAELLSYQHRLIIVAIILIYLLGLGIYFVKNKPVLR